MEGRGRTKEEIRRGENFDGAGKVKASTRDGEEKPHKRENDSYVQGINTKMRKHFVGRS